MKYVTTIQGKDRTAVVLREYAKKDQEYIFKIIMVWHYDGSAQNYHYYPRTIQEGKDYIERELMSMRGR